MKHLLVLVAALVAIGTAQAAQLQPPTGTIAVDQSDLHYGDYVTFTTTYVTPDDTYFPYAYVHLTCWQGRKNNIVLDQIRSSEPVYPPTFFLSGYPWVGGEAHCRADLVWMPDGVYFARTPLATTYFHVAA